MKRLRYETRDIDALDARILRALVEDGRLRVADLARRLGRSAPSVAERVRRLEEAGVITGYAARIDPAALGLGLTALIRIRPMAGALGRVAEILADIDAVTACDRVTGEDCFVARVHVRTAPELEAVIDQITPFASTTTSIVQSTPVPERSPPIPLTNR